MDGRSIICHRRALSKLSGVAGSGSQSQSSRGESGWSLPVFFLQQVSVTFQGLQHKSSLHKYFSSSTHVQSCSGSQGTSCSICTSGSTAPSGLPVDLPCSGPALPLGAPLYLPFPYAQLLPRL